MKRLVVYNIYPNEIQLKESAEEYIIENESDFYESMEDIQWNVFYEDKLAKLVIIKLIRISSHEFKILQLSI